VLLPKRDGSTTTGATTVPDTMQNTVMTPEACTFVQRSFSERS
jgi:hypothetical protein